VGAGYLWCLTLAIFSDLADQKPVDLCLCIDAINFNPGPTFLTALFPAYQGNDPFVFVCYAHADYEAVSAEIWALHEMGINIWYDEGISPGHVFTDEIADRISQCSTFLYFVSPKSVASRNCQNEVQFASARDKRIVAIHLEPTELSGGLELQIGLAQAIFKYQLKPEDFNRKLASVFRVEQQQSAEAPQQQSVPQPRRTPKLMALAMMVIIAVLTSALGAWYFLNQSAENTSVPSIAVLPFTNMSSDAENNYFAEGIAEDIINGLTLVKGLFVVSRTSSFKFSGNSQDVKAIGAALGVLHVLEGSVRRFEDRARISVSLVETNTGRQVWSNQYERDISDVFAVQDEISEAVLSALRIKLMPLAPRPSLAPEAYDAYLKGRNRAVHKVLEARADFERALAIEPDYADAHAGVAWTHIDSIVFKGVAPVEAFAEAQLSVSRALSIDPGQMDALLAEAVIFGTVNRDFQREIDTIEVLVERGAQNMRHSFLIFEILKIVGRCDLGLPVMDEWIKADPLRNDYKYAKSSCLNWLGRFDQAMVVLQDIQAKNRMEDLDNLRRRAEVVFKSGNAVEMIQIIEEVKEKTDAESVLQLTARLHYAEGKYDEARAEAVRALKFDPYSWELYIIADQIDVYIERLERALDNRNFLAYYVIVPEPGNIFSQKLHAHPDMQRLREKAKLDDASLAKLNFKPLID